MSQTNETDLDAPIWGAAAIAKEIKRPVRATFHLLEGGEIPAKKIKGRWVSSKDIPNNN